MLGQAQAGLSRMNTLLEDLVGYAQAGLSPGAAVPLTPSGAALRWAIENLRAAVADSAAKITHGELPTVPADPSQLAQVFQNLLANAIKYRTPENAPVIHVGAARLDGEWLFSVADNGIGFDPEYANYIFAPFRRLHSHQEYPGTGVGLAICKKIIDAHGGRIWAQSSPGHGATFLFTLPDLR